MTSIFSGLPQQEPSRRVGFSGNIIDRRSESRHPDTLAAALADPAARFLILRGDEAVLGPDGTPLFERETAERIAGAVEAAVLLGWNDGTPRLALALPAEAAIDEALGRPATLRALASAAAADPDFAGPVGAAPLGALAQARALFNWHASAQFCGRCGAPTVAAIAGYRRDCTACGTQTFPRTDPVAIMLAVEGDRCLLGRQPRFPKGMYSCLAGFVEPGETIEDAVRREIREEAGILIGKVRYHASQPWPFPNSLMIGCHAEALSFDVHPDVDELEDCRWFSRAEAASMLAGAHPDGLGAPNPMAIAHELLRSWVEGRIG
ncbi:NAD(+) diphosphatase [Prosthecomicrobium pneumaticum]|uniref:NAD(+) diphosphatase n=1 Tax=Prosthecomicrobium pneumaticum TaxID=81895 RepID=A0A7W9FM40_9HYPH|nr:NAD(+) diphosphatase [Prosthecomicrobium pneumaticum]MBB5753179.1 NAD+ diphosphatase [Prosthecomicrobium pneumaticum]